MTRYSNWASASAVALLGAAILLPSAAAAKPKPAKQAAAQLDQSEEIDKIFPLAIAEGKVILITTTMNVTAKYPDRATIEMHNAGFTTAKDGSAITDNELAVEWQNVDRPGSALIVGNSREFETVGESGSFFQFTAGRTTYQVYIIDPGKYRLGSVTYPMPRTSAPDTDTGRNAKSGIGTVEFNVRTRPEFRASEKWFDAWYEEVPGYSECNYWYKGVCTGGTDYPATQRVTRPAGYYPTQEVVDVPALDVKIQLSADFATFNAPSGQAIIVDGFFAEPPNAEFAMSSCSDKKAGQLACKISAVTLQHYPASASVVKAQDIASRGFPRLAKIVETARVEPLNIRAARQGPASKEIGTYRLSE